MKKKNIIVLSLLGLVLVAGPVAAKTVKQVFTDKVVFQKSVNAQKHIKNSDGAVTIKDNAKVTGNVTVEGNLTVEGETNLNVDAGEVALNTSSMSRLTSSTLDEALEEEIAIDIAEMVKGKTWTVTNTTQDGFFENTTGQVTFSDDGTTFTLDSGFFAATGMVASDADDLAQAYQCSSETKINSPASFTMVGSNTMYVTWTDMQPEETDNVLTAIADNLEELTLSGQGGCGVVGKTRISKLTLVE